MKVVLVADEPLFRLGFRAMVSSTEDVQLVSDAPDARSGFARIDVDRPGLVVMGIALKGMSGIAAARELRSRAPRLRILLLGDSARERDALDGFAAGAHGFAVKSDPSESLLHAMRVLSAGGTYVTPVLRVEIGRLKRYRATSAPAPDVLDTLSPRERDIFELVVKGWRNRMIAREFCVSVKTVDTHRTRINRKLKCRGAADLIRFAADNDLLRRTSCSGSNQATGQDHPSGSQSGSAGAIADQAPTSF